MTQPLTITPLQDSDVDQVIALWQRCDLVVPWNDPREDIAFARGKPNSEILLGRMEGELIASVMVGHDGHRGNVYYVSVDPQHQGQGFGHAIMNTAVDWLRTKGIWKLNIMVRGTNRKVIGFYEQWGAEREDRAVLSFRLRPRLDTSSE